jgi:hypothetical protein
MVVLEMKAKKITYMLLSCNQNNGQNDDINIARKFFENLR